MIPFSAEKKQCCLRQLDSATDLLTPDPLTKHRILPFTVSETQPHFSGSYTRRSHYQLLSLPPHRATAHTACISCVSFLLHSLISLLSAMSWFPLFSLSSPRIPSYLPLMLRQEASSLTRSLYVPEEISWTVRTQTGRVNKITIRKIYIIRALECGFNLRRRGWERIKERGSGWGSPGVTSMQNKCV